MRKFLIAVMGVVISGCVGLPPGVDPVKNFDVNRYMGKWYEIARLDHSFERGLTQVTAEYTRRDDGGVRVVNRGFAADENQWKEIEGKAYFVRSRDEGYLKVSFFGPFYGTYAVFELDRQDYRYAFVAGPSKSYLWLLARTPTVSPELLQRFIDKSEQLGFPTAELILVEQQPDFSRQGPLQKSLPMISDLKKTGTGFRVAQEPSAISRRNGLHSAGGQNDVRSFFPFPALTVP